MIILILSFFIFLFCLYILCRDDFVLLRKSISLEWLFNTALLTIFIGLLSARFVYVLFNFDPQSFNPLVFLLISHFPGLSLIGGILGGILYLIMMSRNKKSNAPIWHITDSFSISLVATILISLIVTIFSTRISFKEIIFPFLLVEFTIYLILFVVLFRLFQKARFKEGSITLLFLVLFSIFSFLSDILVKKNNILTWGAYEDYILIVIFLISAFLFIKEEELLKRLKFRKHMKRTLRKFDL